NAIAGQTSATLDLSTLPGGGQGASISVTATPSDGLTSGAPATTTVNLGANVAPVIDSVTITPAGPKTNQLLTANVTSHDDDGNTVTYTYVWKKNGAVLSGQTNSSLDMSIAGNGNRGDSITVTVTPNDGLIDGTAVQSLATS